MTDKIKESIQELESRINGDKNYQESYKALKKWFLNILKALDENPEIPHPLKHGLSHSERVIYNCMDILKKSNFNTPSGCKDYEISFLILCIGYLHDIGMQIGFNDKVSFKSKAEKEILREEHAQASAQVIRDIKNGYYPEGLNLPQSREARNIFSSIILEVVAFILEHHDKRLDKRELEKEISQKFGLAKEQYLVLMLTALLQVADALHMDSSRVNEELLKKAIDKPGECDSRDLARIFYAYYVSDLAWKELIDKETKKRKWEILVVMGTPYDTTDENFVYIDQLQSVYENRIARYRRDSLYILQSFGIYITTDPNPILQVSPEKCKMPEALLQYLMEQTKAFAVSFSLPIPTENFVNRLKLIKEIISDIEKRKCFILLGDPGIGKTELAVKIGNELQPNFEKALFIPMIKVNSAESIFARLKHALDFPSDINLQQFIFRIKEKNILLVIDNLEDADKFDRKKLIDFFNDILKYIAKPRLILTSRRPIHIEHSITKILDVLPTEDAIDLLKKTAKDKGSNIFTWKDKEVKTLVNETANMPLAITILAQRIGKRALDDIIRLYKREKLSFLTIPGISEEEANRLQSVNASIKLSYDMLSEDTKKTMTFFSFFPDGVNINDIENNIEFSAYIEIEELIENSLLRISPNEKYYMLEPIRLFSEDRFNELSEPEKIKFRRKLISYYSHKLELLGSQIFSPTGAEALHELDSIYANIRYFFEDYLRIINE